MKEGWSYKKLGEVATFSRGLTYSKRDEVDVSDNIVLRSNNIDLLSSKLTFTELKYLHDDFEIPQDKRVKKGSIFICMSNGSKIHLGKVAYIDKDYNYAFGGFMGQITPNKDVDGLYLHHVLMSPSYKKYIKSLSEGANINNLKFKDLSEYVVGYPSLSEQRSIVARLDTAFSHIDALKANAEKQLNEARKLFQAELTECMRPKEGWEEKRFGDVCFYHKEQGRFKDMIYIGMEHMESGTGKILGYTSSNEVLSNTFKFNQGEVLYGRLRPYLQKVYVAEFEGCCSTEVFPIRSNKVESGFIKYWLLREETTNKINATSAGCRMPRGNMNEVKLFEFFYPSRKEIQHSIVSHLDSLSSTIRKLEELQQKTLAECDALKQAMLREVFE